MSGLVMHFMNGVVFFVIYALLFDAFSIAGDTDVIVWGLIFGLVHGAIAGTMLAVMPMMHPRMGDVAHAAGRGIDYGSSLGESDTLPEPGFFGLNKGAIMPVLILMMHAVYAGVAAAVYVAL